MKTHYLIWPEGSPTEARVVKGWWRMTACMFVMGWRELSQFSPRRISRMWGYDAFNGQAPAEVAAYVEEQIAAAKADKRPESSP